MTELQQNNDQNNNKQIEENKTIQTLLNRRSIRAFKNEPISENIVKRWKQQHSVQLVVSF